MALKWEFFGMLEFWNFVKFTSSYKILNYVRIGPNKSDRELIRIQNLLNTAHWQQRSAMGWDETGILVAEYQIPGWERGRDEFSGIPPLIDNLTINFTTRPHYQVENFRFWAVPFWKNLSRYFIWRKLFLEMKCCGVGRHSWNRAEAKLFSNSSAEISFTPR